MKKIIALIFSTFILSCSSSSDSTSSSSSSSWDLLNFSGSIDSMCSINNDLYIGNATGVYRSVDNGNTWNQIKVGATDKFYTVFPINGEIYYSQSNYGGTSATNYSKYNLTSGSWNSVWTSVQSNGYGIPKKFYLLGTKLLGATENYDTDIFVSSNNGSSWNNISSPLAGGVGINFNFISDGNNYYFAGAGGLFKSTNGVEYVKLNNISGLNSSTSLGNKLYVGFQGVKMSTDGGGTWTNINDGLEVVPGLLQTINVLHSNGQNVFCGSANGVYILNNSTWTNIGDFEGTYPTQVGKISTTSNYIFAKGQDGLYRHQL